MRAKRIKSGEILADLRHSAYLCSRKSAKMTHLLPLFSYKNACTRLCIAVSLLLLSGLTACHDDHLSRDQRAARKAAERCYAYLIKGKYDKYVDQMASSEQWPESYRSQMADLMKEHVATLTGCHGALLEVEAVGDTLLNDRAQVFLQVTFSDETSEEIGVPMRRIEGKWRLE